MLQAGSAFLLSTSYSWLVGAALARYWLVDGGVRSMSPACRLRHYDLWVAGLAIVGIVLVLLVGAAAMSGLPLSDVHQVLLPMLSTDFGRTGATVLLALLAYLAWRWRNVARSCWPIELCILVLLTVARASMGHAGEAGLFSAVHVSEALHLAAVGAWTGIVLVSAGPMLGRDHGMAAAGEANDTYLVRMSDAALVAVLVIVTTGIYNSLHRIGSADALLQANDYILVLASKVALVVLALILGAYNKVVGLPRAVRNPTGMALVRTVLRIEALVLLAALLAASLLTVLAPPAAP